MNVVRCLSHLRETLSWDREVRLLLSEREIMEMIMTQMVRVTLVIALILGTVAPVSVFAVDSVEISNSVHSSSNTGGNTSVDGRAGADGAPGSLGTSGSAGTDGADGSDIFKGESRAEVSIENVVDGDVVTEITSATTGNAAIEVDSDIVGIPDGIQTSETATDSVEVSSEVDADTSVTASPSPFDRFVTAVRSLIQKYVSTLF